MAREDKGIKNLNAAVESAIGALKQLMELYRFERFAYLSVAAVSFLLLIYAAVNLFTGPGGVTTQNSVLVLGGSGLATVACSRVGLYLNRGFAVVEAALQQGGVARVGTKSEKGKKR